MGIKTPSEFTWFSEAAVAGHVNCRHSESRQKQLWKLPDSKILAAQNSTVESQPHFPPPPPHFRSAASRSGRALAGAFSARAPNLSSGSLRVPRAPSCSWGYWLMRFRVRKWPSGLGVWGLWTVIDIDLWRMPLHREQVMTTRQG